MEKLTYKYETFIASLRALERSIAVFSHPDISENIREHLVASIIKHYELCYESLWKFLKLYLEKRYAEIEDSPKKVFRKCFAVGLMDEQTTKELLDISESRNSTTHSYDEENAQEVCKRIDQYYRTFTQLEHIMSHQP